MLYIFCANMCVIIHIMRCERDLKAHLSLSLHLSLQLALPHRHTSTQLATVERERKKHKYSKKRAGPPSQRRTSLSLSHLTHTRERERERKKGSSSILHTASTVLDLSQTSSSPHQKHKGKQQKKLASTHTQASKRETVAIFFLSPQKHQITRDS